MLVHDRERPRRPATPSICRAIQAMSQRRTLLGGGDHMNILIPALARVLNVYGSASSTLSDRRSSSSGNGSGGGGNRDSHDGGSSMSSSDSKYSSSSSPSSSGGAGTDAVPWTSVSPAVETIEVRKL